MLFTPISQKTGKRLKMDIVKTIIPRGKWRKEVVEKKTNKKYIAIGAPCNLPNCYCDSILLENNIERR